MPKKKLRKKPATRKRVTAAETTVRYRLPPFVIRLAEDDEGVKVPHKVQLFRTGTFRKWDEEKEQWIQFEITRAMLAEFVENWKKKVRGVDIALDFAHRSDEEAAGWFTDVQLENNGTELWAEVEWTPDGHAAVAGKKFRYISPDFAFAWKDNETGKQHGPTLFGAGLTNRPVIKNMAPTVELTEVEPMDEKELEALKLQLAEQTKTIKALQLKLDEMAEGDDDNDEDDADGEGGDAKGKKKGVDDMDLAEIRAAYQKQCDELAELKKQISKQASEAATATKKATFDTMLGAGKVVEAQREAFMKDDTVKFAELAEPVKLTTVGDGKEPPAVPADTSAQDEVLKLADEYVKAGKATKKGDAISMVLSENKKLSERYNKEMNPPGM